MQATGTFRETWRLQWHPELAITVVEAAVWGTTVEAAATAKIDSVVAGQSRRLTLGPSEYNSANAQAAVVVLPDKQVTSSLGAPFAGSKQWWSGSADNLTSSSGFNGADGVFRFRPDGPNERGLAVLQIASGTTTVLSAAPRSFSDSPS